MGIRIRRYLGYGITDFKGDSDPRFKKPLSEILEWHREEATLEEFEKYAESVDKKDYFFGLAKTDERYDNFSQMLEYDEEFGLSNVLLLMPLNHKDWCRVDDAIDYYEDSLRGDDTGVPYVKMIDRPLYPWSSFVDKETGQNIPLHLSSLIHRGYEDTAKKLGYDSCDDFFNKTTAEIPECIRLFVEWTDMFVDSKTLFEFKPMIYTYWS